jgi:biopolymer transport protein ExbB
MDVFSIILVLVSIVGMVFIVERGLALRRHKIAPPEVEAAVAAFKGPNDLSMLQEIAEKNPSPLTRLLRLAADHRHWPKAENVDTLQTQARHEIMRLERGLVFLEIIVGIAPLLGLIGTIFGLILLFGSLGEAGMSESSRVAPGIATALRATFLGLIAAIPSLVAWSYYSKKIESVSIELETLCDQFMRRLYRQAAAETPARVEKPEKESSAKAEKEMPAKAEKERTRPVEKSSSPATEKEPVAKTEKTSGEKS